MWHLIKRLSLRGLRLRPGRTLITVIGIALGVAMTVAVAMASRTILSSYQRALSNLAGQAQLQVAGPGDGAFSQNALAEVRGVAGVRQAVPLVKGRALVSTAAATQPVLVYAVDWQADPAVRSYALSSGSLPPGDGVVVGAALAQIAHLQVGQEIDLIGTGGRQTLPISGILSEEGAGQGNQGQVVFLSLTGGQRLFGKGAQLDAVDLTLTAGADRDRVAAALRAALPGLSIGAPAERGQEVEEILQGLQFMMWFSGLLALFAGACIVFNNVAVAVRERRRDLSILRALGLPQLQCGGLMLAEALLLGICGSVLGTLLGAAMARVAAAGLADTALAMFSVPVRTVPLQARDVLLALVLGTASTVAAAYLPAREAFSVQPAEALRPMAAGDSPGWRWRPVLSLTALAAGGILAAWLWSAGTSLDRTRFLQLAGISVLGMGMGIVGLGPEWVKAGRRAVAAALRAVLGVAGALGGDGLVRTPGRSAATVSAFLVSIAFMVGFSGFSATYTGFVDAWVDRTINWDLRVSAGIKGIQAEALLPESMKANLQRAPGVALASAQRFVFTEYRNGKVLLSIFEMEDLPKYASLKVLEGLDTPALYQTLARGEGVAITTVTARLFGLHAGDTLRLSTPAGLETLPILALVDAFSPDTGEVYIDRRLYQRYWQDPGVDAFAVKVGAGHTATDVATALSALRPDGVRLSVETQGSFKARLTSLLRQAFAQVQGLVLVTVLVGCLSILNTLTIAVLEQQTELALLRALGATRSRVGLIVLAQALGIGLYGAVLGGACGVGLAYLLAGFNRQFSGLHLEPTLPALPLLTGMVMALVLAPLAALLPARRAANLPPAAALRSD